MPRRIVIDPNRRERFFFEEVAWPEPHDNEAIVNVKAFSLNLGEIRKAYAGTKPLHPGWDLAGIVTCAAADGTGPAVGQVVVGMLNFGSWAEQVAVPTQNLATVPETVSIEQASTLPIAGITAIHAIERATGLLGRKVLVTGASGGVGHFACQLARLSGGRVFGTIRQMRYQPLLEGIGLEQAIFEENTTEVQKNGPYRLIVDTVGGNVLARSIPLLAPEGVCITLAASAGSKVLFDVWSLAQPGRASLSGLIIFNEIQRESVKVSLDRLIHLVSTDLLRPHIAVEASWTEIITIADRLWNRCYPGKVVLHIP
jgi:NADPH:quinone reductase-like Zn-dependent oxidoreductase